MMTRVLLTFLVGLVVSLGGCQESLKRLDKSAGSLGSTLASDRIVCNAATSGGKWLSARNNYVIEAKSRGLSCGVSEVSNQSTTPSSASSTDSLSKADKSKAFCKDIGFTAGTEKFGECVLKMMDK